MRRDDESSHDKSGQNEHQHGWEHIPNNELEILSPNSCLPPPSTVYEPSQFPTRSEQDQYNWDNVAAIPRKNAEDRYEEVLDTAPRLNRRRFLSEWWQEMLSALSSVLCLMTIVVILYKVNGKLLLDWDELVSLNAVISVLSTGGKACLILLVAECIS